MSFILPVEIGDVSSIFLQQMVIRTSNRLAISESKAVFLLLQYNWNENSLVEEIARLSKLTRVFTNSVDDIADNSVDDIADNSDDTYDELSGEPCSVCGGVSRKFTRLGCKHVVCQTCLLAHLRHAMASKNLVIYCPSLQGCTKYINPSVFDEYAGRLEYSRILLEDFIAKTQPVQPVFDLLQPVDNERVQPVFDLLQPVHNDRVQRVFDPLQPVHNERVQLVFDPLQLVHNERVQPVLDPLQQVHNEQVQLVIDPLQQVHNEQVQPVIEQLQQVHNEPVQPVFDPLQPVQTVFDPLIRGFEFVWNHKGALVDLLELR